MTEQSIGKRIATLRKEKGWTQVELAEKLSVSDKTVSKWESDGGYPEISQLPVMANIFGVSIDYLMTGKTPEKEIITMSKAELCAKNDDASMAEEVIDLPNDENGKNITDYVLQYRCFKVFEKLCEVNRNFIERFNIIDAITLAILANKPSVLAGARFMIERNWQFTFESENEIKSLLPEEDKEKFRDYRDQCICIIPRKFFNVLVTDKRINENTIDFLLSPQSDRKCVWYHALPYMIDEAYSCGNEALFRKFIGAAKENNDYAYANIQITSDRYDREYNYVANYFFMGNRGGNGGYGLVRILDRTFKSAFDKGDIEMISEFNGINNAIRSFVKNTQPIFADAFKCYVATDDEIRIAKLKLDKNVSDTELKIQSAVHNGIISINELAQVKDFNAVKRALYEYPIHYFEIVYNLYADNKQRELFRFAVDNGNARLADAVINNDTNCIEAELLSYCTKADSDALYRIADKVNINRNELYADEKSNAKKLKYSNSVREAVEYLQKVKERIVNELSLKIDKSELVGKFTKEYFEKELKAGNRDMVIINLCVRFEAVLKCNYGYADSFVEMIDEYCKNQLTRTEDDGWGYENTSYDKISLLHKLRKERNSLVHAEKTNDKLTDEELKNCIEYICSIE